MAERETADRWGGVGAQVRVARQAKNMSVRELARRLELSPSHVSQVERGLASFSVRALYNVVHELDISMDSLFEGGHVPPELVALESPVAQPRSDTDPLAAAHIVQRSGNRPAISLAGGPRWERLTPNPETGAEFIEVVYPPKQGKDSPTDLIRHASREYGIITQGELSVQVGFERSVLGVGDSIAFDSMTPHRFWNDTDGEVRAVWFILDVGEHDS